jgi:5-methylcytosine-specific restriction endonuclease McrA
MMSSAQKRRKKERLAARFGVTCQICGVAFPLAELTLDHIQPRGEGGRDGQKNLRLACGPCNWARHRTPTGGANA